MKDAYYFSHDTNARNDPKCAALIHEYGPEGYGVFWMMIETLSEQNNYRLKKFNKLYEGLAAQFRIEVGRLRSIIEALLHDYELLLQDDLYIWSDSLLRRMEAKEAKRMAKVEAGRKGGLKSGVTRNKQKDNEANTKQNEALLEANEPKESKVKESILNKKDIGDLILEFTDNVQLRTALNEFVRMRIKIKKPMTERAISNLLKKLNTMTTEPAKQIAILDQSINNCWQDIYEPKPQQQRSDNYRRAE